MIWQAFVKSQASRKWIALTCALVLGSSQVAAQQPIATSSKSVYVAAGHSSLLDFSEPIERASVNDAVVADVVVISPTELLIHGKEPGSTSLIVWRGGKNELYVINVERNLETLEQALKRLFPNEKMGVHSASGVILLSGKVSSQSIVDEAVKVAQNLVGDVVSLIEVERRALDEMLRELFPNEAITVHQTHKGIILTGQVSEEAISTQAEEAAKLYSEDVNNFLRVAKMGMGDLLNNLVPGEDMVVHELKDRNTIILAGKAKHPANLKKAQLLAASTGGQVVDLVDVPDQKQVLIEVRFLEVQRSIGESFGLNYWVQGPDFSTGSFTGRPLSSQTPATPQFARIEDGSDISISDAVNQLFEFRGGTDITTALNLLEEEGLIRILAEPNLLAMSGEEASFLAGGEFPIPVLQGTSTSSVTIEYKEYGVRLNFIPEVTADDVVVLKVTPEVSVLDFSSAAVTISGFSIPALTTRRASTKVQMKPGESLVIGGLLSQQDTNADKSIPYLSDIPILGKLFTSESFARQETELIVIATPRLKEPQKLDTPEKYSDPELINEAIESIQSEAPYAEERADDLQEAIQGFRNPEEPVNVIVKPEPAEAVAEIATEAITVVEETPVVEGLSADTAIGEAPQRAAGFTLGSEDISEYGPLPQSAYAHEEAAGIEEEVDLGVTESVKQTELVSSTDKAGGQDKPVRDNSVGEAVKILQEAQEVLKDIEGKPGQALGLVGEAQDVLRGDAWEQDDPTGICKRKTEKPEAKGYTFGSTQPWNGKL